MHQLERRRPPRHLRAPARDRPRPLLPAAARRRLLDAVDSGLGATGGGRSWAADAGRARGSRRADRGHALRTPTTSARPPTCVELTGAPVSQGGEDDEQCVDTWGEPALARSGSRPKLGRTASRSPRSRPSRAVGLAAEHGALRARARAAQPGDAVDGWEVVLLPGHADGHLGLVRDGVLIAGDALLGEDHAERRPLGGLAAGPARGLPRLPGLDRGARPAGRLCGPRGDDRQPEGAGPGADRAPRDAARAGGRRARRRRPDRLRGLPQPRPEELAPALRRFALAETRAHLEYLVRRDGAVRLDGDGLVRYAASG